ncbi:MULTISPECIES: response regulator [unclassified Streptococcus]|uniref:response regulator n=1 Tax=unclassified Streptococcus TaxID=2608887 RepID=UPI00156467A1|nr:MULTISPECIES: response regulator transcription factor [unclassified Streptococcus]
MIKVMIADDQALIRESLQIILSVYADIDVVSVVGDGIEAMDNIMTVKPDIILMDIRMPRMDGVLATKEIKKRFPNIKIIILTTFDDDEFIFSALKYGASGYLLKGVSTDELYQAIQTVYKGGSMINPNIASKVFQLFSQMAQTNFSITVKEENIENISLTEWKIIQQVAFGESNKEIASNLFLSEGTVRNYLSIILSKLNLRDRTQLAIWAVQTGVTQKNFSKEMDK